jgi:two-component system LytT family response regulator
VRRALEHRRARSGESAPPSGAPPSEERRSDRLAFKTDGRIIFLRPEEIVWAEADDNYVTLHLSSGRLMLRETLTAIENRLGPAHFTRVNRSAVVNLDQIKELQPALHGDYTVVLRDGTRLPLSRALRGRFERF